LSKRTFVIGVGMTKFEKPGTKVGDHPGWEKEAGEKALADTGIPYDDIVQVYAGCCCGDSTYGQRALYGLGLTGIPVVNVNIDCSTGSSALFVVRQVEHNIGLGGAAVVTVYKPASQGPPQREGDPRWRSSGVH